MSKVGWGVNSKKKGPLEDLKEVQEKIQKDLAQMVGITKETELLLKIIKE